jgi:hypothetical protein
MAGSVFRGWRRAVRQLCQAAVQEPALCDRHAAQLGILTILVRDDDSSCLMRSRLYSSAVPQLDGSCGWGLQSELWADERGAAGASSCIAWRPPSPNAPAMLIVSDGSGLWMSNVAMPQAPTSGCAHALIEPVCSDVCLMHLCALRGSSLVARRTARPMDSHSAAPRAASRRCGLGASAREALGARRHCLGG